MEGLHETTYAAKWENGDVVRQCIVEGNQSVRVWSLYTGYPEHALLHALGRAVLAAVPPSQLTTYVGSHAVEQRTPHAKPINAIMPALEEIRNQGYAVDVGEWEIGLCCLAAPILPFDETLWGPMAISVPTHRFNPADYHTLSGPLQDKALDISRSMGYRSMSLAKASTRNP